MCEKHLCVHAEFSFLLLDLCAERFISEPPLAFFFPEVTTSALP